MNDEHSELEAIGLKIESITEQPGGDFGSKRYIVTLKDGRIFKLDATYTELVQSYKFITDEERRTYQYTRLTALTRLLAKKLQEQIKGTE